MERMWFVYVLKSVTSTFVYVGFTTDLEKRLQEHNEGLNQSTKHYAPFRIVAYVAVPTEQQAVKLEKYFKTGSGKAVLNKRIIGLPNEAH